MGDKFDLGYEKDISFGKTNGFSSLSLHKIYSKFYALEPAKDNTVNTHGRGNGGASRCRLQRLKIFRLRIP